MMYRCCDMCTKMNKCSFGYMPGCGFRKKKTKCPFCGYTGDFDINDCPNCLKKLIIELERGPVPKMKVECLNCGFRGEVVILDNNPKECPECRRGQLHFITPDECDKIVTDLDQ